MDRKENYRLPVAWTIQEVARELKVSTRHIYRLVMKDQISYTKIGRSLRFSPSQIEDWIKRGGTK